MYRVVSCRNSYCVYGKEILIGFGRFVSDKYAHAMIYNLIVLPEYQGKGIGSAILKKLLDWCADKNIGCFKSLKFV